MSSTDELRALLDERGVEHYDGTETTLWGYEPTSESTGVYRFSADETSGGRMQVRMFNLTPEQAIAATLGREDVYTREDMEGAFVSGYSLGSLPVGSDPRWDENRQTVDEHMAELGWVRKEAATMGGSDATEARRSDAVEVVRCRDCEHYRERINGCVEFGDESRGEYANVEPDGFCAWGERKDA